MRQISMVLTFEFQIVHSFCGARWHLALDCQTSVSCGARWHLALDCQTSVSCGARWHLALDCQTSVSTGNRRTNRPAQDTILCHRQAGTRYHLVPQAGRHKIPFYVTGRPAQDTILCHKQAGTRYHLVPQAGRHKIPSCATGRPAQDTILCHIFRIILLINLLAAYRDGIQKGLA